jgi:hypothetical protein
MALPDYLEETAKDYAKNLTAATSVPIDTSKFTGRDFIAGEDPLSTRAINLATSGIGSYQPFLDDAKKMLGPGSGTGVGSIASFMSPYQDAVIDESLRQFDDSRKAGLQNIGERALDVGAFGGGRQGALEGQFMADTALGRAGLEATLRQQGFQDAARRRQDNLANIFNVSNFGRAGMGADVATLGNLGAFRTGLESARLAADADAARTAAYEPFGRLSTYGSGLTGLAGGMAQPAFQQPAAPSPFSTALSTALGIGNLFGKFK